MNQAGRHHRASHSLTHSLTHNPTHKCRVRPDQTILYPPDPFFRFPSPPGSIHLVPQASVPPFTFCVLFASPLPLPRPDQFLRRGLRGSSSFVRCRRGCQAHSLSTTSAVVNSVSVSGLYQCRTHTSASPNRFTNSSVPGSPGFNSHNNFSFLGIVSRRSSQSLAHPPRGVRLPPSSPAAFSMFRSPLCAHVITRTIISKYYIPIRSEGSELPPGLTPLPRTRPTVTNSCYINAQRLFLYYTARHALPTNTQ
jgi:hypothetical protein